MSSLFTSLLFGPSTCVNELYFSVEVVVIRHCVVMCHLLVPSPLHCAAVPARALRPAPPPIVAHRPPRLRTGGRWQSKENLLSDMVDDPETFVALYDFQAQGDNQLSLKKGTT